MLPVFAGGGDIRTKTPAALRPLPKVRQKPSSRQSTDKAAGTASPPREIRGAVAAKGNYKPLSE
jgi:hypothetical protein